MEKIKDQGFTIALVAMLLVLGAFAYFYTWDKVSKYKRLEDELVSNASQLVRLSRRSKEQLPSKQLAALKNQHKSQLESALAAGEAFYKKAFESLTMLQFQPGGEVFGIDQKSEMSSAYTTALEQLNEKYRPYQEAYMKKVFPEEIVNDPEVKIPEISPEPDTDFTTDKGCRQAAQMCRVTHAIVNAAVSANWGGITHIGFEFKEQARAQPEEPRDERRRGRGPVKREEIKEIDPRTLYSTIEAVVGGEIRYKELIPFIRNLRAQASPEQKKPVLFRIKDLYVRKRKEQLTQKQLYTAEFENEEEARAASYMSHVKVPTARFRLVLSVLKWKGFASQDSKQDSKQDT